MALYSGRDLIAITGISKAQVRRIVDAYGIRKIGEIRFTAGFPYSSDRIPGLKKKDGIWHLDDTITADGHILSNDFDGWVYPNGEQYACRDFPAASAVYATSPAAPTFSVPNLADSFFKGHAPLIDARDPGSGATYNLLGNVPAYNKIPKTHYHSISEKTGINTQLTILSGFVFCAAGNFGTSSRTKKCETTDKKIYYVPCLHSGNHTYDKRNKAHDFIPLPLDMTLKLGDLSAFFGSDAKTSSAKDAASGAVFSDNPPAVPEHHTMPVMIYIGMTVQSESAAKTFPVRFISSVDSTQISLQWVQQGQSATYPSTKPTYDHWVWHSWDATPITNIQGPTTVIGNYVRKTYTLELIAKIQTLLPRYVGVVTTPAAGSLAIKIIKRDGTIENKSLAVSGTFGSRNTASYSIQSEAKVEITASPSSGIFKTWSGDYSSTSIKLIIPTMAKSSSITGEFGNSYQVAGWQWIWNIEYNCDNEENRVHYLDNVANYTYAAGALFDSSTGEVAGEVQEKVTNNPSTNTLNPLNREYIKLGKVTEDPNFEDPDDKSSCTRIEDYGLFLLDTRSQARLPVQYKANLADGEQFYGFAFPARDLEGRSITFVSPVTAPPGLMLNGWEFPSDTEVTSIDADGRIMFTSDYAPAIRPIPSENGATAVKFDTESAQKIRKATAAEYAAFWGSLNPKFI